MSHDKLKLHVANSFWQTQVGMCERHTNVGKHVGKLLETNRDKFYMSSPGRQQFVNMSANTSLPTLVCHVKAA